MTWPIKEQVMQALEARLDVISPTLTASVRPSSRVDAVQRPTTAVADINPAHGVIVVVEDDAEPAEATPQEFLTWRLPVDLYCYVAQAEVAATPIDALISVMEADVMKGLADEAWRVGLGGLIETVSFDAERRFAADGGLQGTVVRVLLTYRHRFTDPYSRV